MTLKLTQSYESIVEHLQSCARTDEEKANFAGTPDRATRAIKSMVRPWTEIVKELSSVPKQFPIKRNEDRPAGLLTQGASVARSMCPHHLLPVMYEVYLSYISKSEVVGLSKLDRVARLLAKRAVLQEQYTLDVAEFFHMEQSSLGDGIGMESDGSCITVLGMHTCMLCRGTEVQPGNRTLTTEMTGCFWDDPTLEMKHQTNIDTIRKSLSF